MSGPTRTVTSARRARQRGGHPGWQHLSYTNKWPGTSVGSWIDRAPGLTIHKGWRPHGWLLKKTIQITQRSPTA